MVANCGQLPGGLTLVPQAVIDDGRLDVTLVDTRAGLIGWASLAAQIIAQGFGFRTLPRLAAGRLWNYQARTVRVDCATPAPLQIDGEFAGPATSFDVTVQPAALRVRVPRKGSV
jgi:diacylglycerol kinase family enzyme